MHTGRQIVILTGAPPGHKYTYKLYAKHIYHYLYCIQTGQKEINKQTNKQKKRKGKKNPGKKKGRKKRWKKIRKVMKKNCLKYDYLPITHYTNTYISI